MIKKDVILVYLVSIILMAALAFVFCWCLATKYWCVCIFVAFAFAACEAVREEASKEIKKMLGGKEDVQKEDNK